MCNQKVTSLVGLQQSSTMLRGISLLCRTNLRSSVQVPKLNTTASNRAKTTFTRFPPNKGLYDSSLEKDSCGVGLVAHLKKTASRQIVLDANEMLVRMSHRGACGCEANSGDGAGTNRFESYTLFTRNLFLSSSIYGQQAYSLECPMTFTAEKSVRPSA